MLFHDIRVFQELNAKLRNSKSIQYPYMVFLKSSRFHTQCEYYLFVINVSKVCIWFCQDEYQNIRIWWWKNRKVSGWSEPMERFIKSSQAARWRKLIPSTCNSISRRGEPRINKRADTAGDRSAAACVRAYSRPGEINEFRIEPPRVVNFRGSRRGRWLPASRTRSFNATGY